MKIIFSSHSLLKLKHRNISKIKVIQTIRKPDIVMPSLVNRKLAYKKFGKLCLKVVFIEENSIITIITQYWDEKLDKKL